MPDFKVQVFRDGVLAAFATVLADDNSGALRQFVRQPLVTAGEPEDLVARVKQMPKGEWVNFFRPR